MSRIFKNATRVLILLGRNEENIAEMAFNFVRRLVETFEHHEKRDKFQIEYIDNLAERS